MTAITLNVQGMSCNHCVNAIETALNEIGVESVNVDLSKNTVDVSYDDQKITLDKIKEAIDDAGYDVA